MSEKGEKVDDVAYTAHDENAATKESAPEVAADTGRRGSVALNIVENPLRVSLSNGPNCPNSSICLLPAAVAPR
jgi:hypothetical protein